LQACLINPCPAAKFAMIRVIVNIFSIAVQLSAAVFATMHKFELFDEWHKKNIASMGK
jgi:hypothetical protein